MYWDLSQNTYPLEQKKVFSYQNLKSCFVSVAKLKISVAYQPRAKEKKSSTIKNRCLVSSGVQKKSANNKNNFCGYYIYFFVCQFGTPLVIEPVGFETSATRLIHPSAIGMYLYEVSKFRVRLII